MGVLGLKFVVCVPEELDCAHAVAASTDSIAVVVCQSEYARWHDPATGARLAGAFRRASNLDAASAIATGLLATSARSDALQILGKIAITQNRLKDARTALESARGLHISERSPGKTAVDDQALAHIFRDQANYVEALRALDACIVEAHEGHDAVIEGYCHMSAGTVLGEIGYFEAAGEELSLSRSLLVMDRDLASLELERGGLDQRYGLGLDHRNYHAQAVVAFERAIAHARKAERPSTVQSAELNLVYSLAELGRFDEATRHLEIARILDVNAEDTLDRALLQARIAYRRGDHALASSIHARIHDQISDDEDRLAVSAMQGRIALAAHDFELAITWARRGVEIAEKVRAAQSVIELRPWLLSAHREPYEILFTGLARAGHFKEALFAVDLWQGRTLLDAMARDRSTPGGLRTAAMHTDVLQRLFPVLSNAPIMAPARDRDLLATLATVDLVALVVAEGELWRIASRAGQIKVVDIGPVVALQPQLDEFRKKPTETANGDALGKLLLGADAYRTTDQSLFVLLDGPLAGLPVAALRHDGRFLIATRTIVRAARLSEIGCVPTPPAPRRVVVIANARGDLRAAEAEANDIAVRFGVVPATRLAATRAALFGAATADLLHVAVHADIDLGGGSLILHDESVSAIEIASHSSGPSLVVLSACSSAMSQDGELATSLATAFLASGSKQVIGTLRPVSDPGARELTSAFYRSDGVRDPPRVLARVQLALAATDNVDWPNFVLFGHDTCRATPR